MPALGSEPHKGDLVSSTYLKKSIAAILAMAALGHSLEAGATGNNNSSTNELDPVVVPFVPNPYDVGIGGGFDYGVYDGPYDSGSGSDGGGGEEGSACPALIIQKPPGCDGYQHLFGADWGRNLYPSGSGLGRLMALLYPEGSVLFGTPDHLQQRSWNMIYDALWRHTEQLAVINNASGPANEALIDSVRAACDEQARLTNTTFDFSDGTCYTALTRVIAEYDGSADRQRNFWLGLPFPDFVIDYAAPENSLRIKHNALNLQARCNVWHKEMVANGC